MGDGKSKIIIIGAGASGIAAATRLLESGFHDVTILEAENRIGGRIYSVEFGGKVVDLGGTWDSSDQITSLPKDSSVWICCKYHWQNNIRRSASPRCKSHYIIVRGDAVYRIFEGGLTCPLPDALITGPARTKVHGEEGNLVYELVKDLDLLSPSHLPQDPGMSFFLLDGSVPEKNITDRLFAIAMDVKDDKECAKQHRGSFSNYFTSEYNERVKTIYQNNEQALYLAKLVEQWFQKFMVLLNPAESWEQLSTTSHYVFRPCEGDQMLGWRSKGYKTIIDVMARKIPDPSQQLPLEEKILLNKEANKILWDNEADEQVTVKCTDGSVYKANHVIVTTSVGVLKDVYKKLFVPALPEYKINSIEGVPLGTVNKILLKFPTKWWPDTIKDISFLWSEEEKQELGKDFAHGPIVNGRSWLENLFSFIALDSHPNVLLGWVNGPTAKLVELLSDEIVIEGAMYMLRKFAGKRFEIPEPDGILRSKWGGNPHFRGSYVYVSADMEKRKASAEDLSKPLIVNGKPVVLFAGEATHSYLFSTVNGAMETGYREADRLVNWHSK